MAAKQSDHGCVFNPSTLLVGVGTGWTIEVVALPTFADPPAEPPAAVPPPLALIAVRTAVMEEPTVSFDVVTADPSMTRVAAASAVPSAVDTVGVIGADSLACVAELATEDPV
jgi:hypothetical protein